MVWDKLNSVDSDIRFMGLEDLEESLTSSTKSSAGQANLSPEIVRKIVSLITDPDPTVQNRAVKVMGALTLVVHWLELVNLVLAQAGASTRQQGTVLKKICQSLKPENLLTSETLISKLNEHPQLFSTSEGCDAIYEYMQQIHGRSSPQSPESQVEFDLVVEFYLIDHEVPPFSRGFDLLTLGVPMVSDASWEKQVWPALQSRLEQKEYLEAVSQIKKVSRCESVLPYFQKILKTATTAENSALLATTLKVLKNYTNISGQAAKLALKLAPQFLVYGSGENNLGDDGLADDTDALYAEADEWENEFEEDYFSDNEHEDGSEVRSAAVELMTVAAVKPSTADASTTSLGNALVAALTAEVSEPVRAAMYRSIDALVSVFNREFLTADMRATIREQVTRDTQNSRSTQAKVAGINLLLSLRDFEIVASLVEYEVDKHQGVCVPQVVDCLHRLLRAQHPRPTEMDASNIQKLSLMYSRLLRAPKTVLTEDTITKILTQVVSHQLADLVENVVQVSEHASNRKLEAYMLKCAAELTTDHTPQHLLDLIAQRCLKLVDTESHTILATLSFLPALAIETASQIGQKITEILRNNIHMPATDTERAYDLLFTLPVAYRESIISVIEHTGDQQTKCSVFEQNIPKSIEFPVFQWAVKHGEAELISKMAAVDPRVLSWAFQTPDLTVHIAAVRGSVRLPQHHQLWASLANAVYKFSATKFSDLQEDQLLFLIAISHAGISINSWYSVATIVETMNTTAPKGDTTTKALAELVAREAALANNSTSSGISASEIISVFAQINDEDTRNYCCQMSLGFLTDPVLVFRILHQYPRLQSNFTGTNCIVTPEIASEFARTFQNDPQFVIATARYLDPAIGMGMNSVLEQFARGQFDRQVLKPIGDTEVYQSVRAQALSILRFTIPTDIDGIRVLLSLINSILQPDPNLVKEVVIGPFKMKIDELDLAREEALNALATCITPEADPKLLSESIRLVAQYRLEDNAQKSRLVAYRWLLRLMDTSYGNELVKPYHETIREQINKQLDTPPKKNSVSWVLQEARELQLAAEELRLQLEN